MKDPETYAVSSSTLLAQAFLGYRWRLFLAVSALVPRMLEHHHLQEHCRKLREQRVAGRYRRRQNLKVLHRHLQSELAQQLEGGEMGLLWVSGSLAAVRVRLRSIMDDQLDA